MSDNAEENQEPVPENITQDPQPEPQPIEADVPRETISMNYRKKQNQKYLKNMLYLHFQKLLQNKMW